MMVKLIGIVGLLLISIGIITRQRRETDILDIIGGGCLLIYSIHIKDSLFIVLQVIFILAAVYALITQKTPKKILRKRKVRK